MSGQTAWQLLNFTFWMATKHNNFHRNWDWLRDDVMLNKNFVVMYLLKIRYQIIDTNINEI